MLKIIDVQLMFEKQLIRIVYFKGSMSSARPTRSGDLFHVDNIEVDHVTSSQINGCATITGLLVYDASLAQH